MFLLDRITPAQILREADGKGGGGGGVTAKVDWPDEVKQGFKNLINKQGGEADAALKLYEENYEHRKRIRELEEEIEGTNSISDEEYEQFQAFKELADDPEELENKLEKGQEAIQKNAKYEREKQNSQVADVYDWNPKVLNRLSDEDAEYEVKTRKNDEGEDEQYAVIKTEDGEKDLQEYAQENWDDMMPALKANGQSGDGEEESSNQKKFSKQKSSSDSKKNEENPLQKWKEKNKKAAGITSDDDE